MIDNTKYLTSFNYPKNRDKTISNFGLKILLALFLIYVYFKQEGTLEQYVFIFFIFILLVQLFIEIKTFYLIDKVSIDKNFLILQKNETITSKTMFQNLVFKVTLNPIDMSGKIVIDFYEQDTTKHLINFKSSEIENKVFNNFIENLSKLSNRDKDDFLTTSHNQLLSFSQEHMNEQTIQGEFIKYTKSAFFQKYNFLVVIGVTIVVLLTSHILRN